MELDLSDFSPALLEAAELRSKQLGYESVHQYFEALLQDEALSPTDPAMHAFLMQLGKEDAAELDEVLLRATRERSSGESSDPDVST